MNPFTLAYREQKQLFLFEKTYLWGTLFKVGGLATLLARFMVQFFWNPKVALVLTLFLLTLSAWMLWVFVRRSRKERGIIPLCLIPACFLGASLSDNSLHFEFLTSILLVQVGLLIYKRIKSKRLLWGVLLTVIADAPIHHGFLLPACLRQLVSFCSPVPLKKNHPVCFTGLATSVSKQRHFTDGLDNL